LVVICPSCAASNYCPEMAAGLTVCCRKCKTQISLPEAPNARPPRWYATPYWVGVVLAEAVLAAALAGLGLLLVHRKPPADLPLLDPAATGGAWSLAAPGARLTLTWKTDLASAGGYFSVEGQNVTLHGPINDVAVRQNRWTHAVFQPEHAPAPEPVVLEFQVRLPDDATIEGEEVTLRVAANVEYPGWSRPDGPVTLCQGSVSREWPLKVATWEQRVAFARYLRGRRWLQGGVVACAALALALALAAGPLARRSLHVECPKCGRVSVCTYYTGGGKLHTTPCPHKGSLPVQSRRG